MKFSRRAAFFAILAAASIATPAPAAEIPGEYEMTVSMSNIMGNLLALHQLSAVLANSELSKRGILKKDHRVKGWISDARTDRGGVLLTYFGEEGGATQVLYRVFVDRKGTSSIETLAPAQPLTESERARVAARELAMADFAKRSVRCADHYDAIVLPFARTRDPFIYVYLLAKNNSHRVAVAGGEVRYEISADGAHLDDQRTFGEGCLKLDIPKRKKIDKAEAIRMTQVPDPTPTEWQVLVSRTSSRTLEVDTPESGLSWKVQKGKIELVGPIRN